MQRELLPVYAQKEIIINAVKENQVIVVEAPTGSGKTTQIPQILCQSAELHGKDNNFKIGVTQPRRIAATSVASRIAFEMGADFSNSVGYKIRFEDATTEKTRIKIMTDGILLQELHFDPLLNEYDIIMVDEAHERSLNIDFIMGLLKNILTKRPEFKVIISSATINAKTFSEYFNNCPVISIDAKIFPIDVIYRPAKGNKEEEYIDMAAKISGEIINSSSKGDILIFMPGEAAIKKTINLLREKKKPNLMIIPLYGQLSIEDQNKVFQEYPGCRKIVAATNIAETSITINGIGYVIDSGICKLNNYNPSTFTSSLVTGKISRASCEQRKGRAGRTQKGYCYRLFSSEDYDNRDEFTKEEIYRTDLTEVVLRMADLGINDYENFDFISPPGVSSIRSAAKALQLLGALDENKKISELGKQMAAFPLSPRISRMLLEAIKKYPDVVNELLIIASFLSTKRIYLLPLGKEKLAHKMHDKLGHSFGDFTAWVKLFNKYKQHSRREDFCSSYYLDKKVMDEILNIHGQLAGIVHDFGGSIGHGGSYKHLMLAVLTGFFQNICRKNKKGNSFTSITENNILIHPGSALFGKKMLYIVSGEIVHTARTYARSTSIIEKEWILLTSEEIYKKLFPSQSGRSRNRSRYQGRRSRYRK